VAMSLLTAMVTPPVLAILLKGDKTNSAQSAKPDPAEPET
jgi:hypothetical protein